jgi:hypothetical protein
MIDENANGGENDKPSLSANSKRIEKAGRARARSYFNKKVPDIKVMAALSDKARFTSISNIVDTIGINISQQYRDEFIRDIVAVLYTYLETRDQNTGNKKSIELMSSVFLDMEKILSTLISVSNDETSKSMLDKYISLELTEWWSKENERSGSKTRTVSLDNFTLVYENMASTEDVVASLSLLINSFSVFVTFLNKTARLTHDDYDLVEKLAELWHHYFGVHPTPSQNEYVPKNKRPTNKMKPSRQFELFIQEIVPNPKIPKDIIRSALKSYKANLGGEK